MKYIYKELYLQTKSGNGYNTLPLINGITLYYKIKQSGYIGFITTPSSVIGVHKYQSVKNAVVALLYTFACIYDVLVLKTDTIDLTENFPSLFISQFSVYI